MVDLVEEGDAVVVVDVVVVVDAVVAVVDAVHQEVEAEGVVVVR